jgi:hypothetical protein
MLLALCISVTTPVGFVATKCTRTCHTGCEGCKIINGDMFVGDAGELLCGSKAGAIAVR